jgi:hypothetical protein
VLAAQGENRDALNVYQQSLTIFRLLAKQDKSNAGWQRELIVTIYKVATTVAKIGGHEKSCASPKSLFERH